MTPGTEGSLVLLHGCSVTPQGRGGVGPPCMLQELVQLSQEFQPFLPPSLSPQLYLQGQESPQNSLTQAHLEFSFPKPPVPSKQGPSQVHTRGAGTGTAPLQFSLAWSLQPAPHRREPIIRAPTNTPSADGPTISSSLLFTLYCSCFCTGKALLESTEILQISAGSRALPNHSHYLEAGNGHLSHVNLKTESARAGHRGRSMFPAAAPPFGWFLGGSVDVGVWVWDGGTQKRRRNHMPSLASR